MFTKEGRNRKYLHVVSFLVHKYFFIIVTESLDNFEQSCWVSEMWVTFFSNESAGVSDVCVMSGISSLEMWLRSASGCTRWNDVRNFREDKFVE